MSLWELDGRARSFQTPEDLERIIANEMRSLTDDEKVVLESMLEDFWARQSGHAPVDEPSLADQYRHVIWKRDPVDVRSFVLDEYYLGDTCYGIFPKLLDDLVEIFEGDYKEIIFTGAIGTGKTYVSSVGLCRVLYELSCMESPQAAFGLTPETPIIIACISVSEDLAKEVALKNIVGKIAASAYFKEHFPFKITQKNIRFPNNVQVVARATTPQSMLGMSVLAALVDETNFMPQRRNKQADRHGLVNMAKVIYDNVHRRMFSRYGSKGKLFLPSSKSTVESFISDRIRAAKTDPSIFVRDYSLWDVKPDDFSDQTFHVLCGNEQVQSQIVPESEVDELKADLPDRTVLIEVPEDLRKAFESDLEGSIRDMAGVATVAISPFIQRVQKVRDMADGRVHPFSVEVFDPSIGGDFMWDRLVESHQERNFEGHYETVYRPLLNPHIPRHLHIDPALNGCAAGIAMGHVAGFKTVHRVNEKLNPYTIRAEMFVVDFVLKIKPPVGGELDFSIYERLVLELMRMGFPIKTVTADQWQSEYFLQRLGKRGLHVDKISMDSTWEPYQNLKLALYEDRLKSYYYKPLFQELQSLEADWERRKINKPQGGSKDVADSVAGFMYSLLKFRASDPLPMMKGMTYFGDEASSFAAQAMGMQMPRGVQPDGQELPGDDLSLLPPILIGSGGGEWDG